MASRTIGFIGQKKNHASKATGRMIPAVSKRPLKRFSAYPAHFTAVGARRQTALHPHSLQERLVGRFGHLDLSIQDPQMALQAEFVDELAGGDPGAADDGADLVLGVVGQEAVPLALLQRTEVDGGAHQLQNPLFAGVEDEVFDLMAQDEHLSRHGVHDGVSEGPVLVKKPFVRREGDFPQDRRLHGFGDQAGGFVQEKRGFAEKPAFAQRVEDLLRPVLPQDVVLGTAPLDVIDPIQGFAYFEEVGLSRKSQGDAVPLQQGFQLRVLLHREGVAGVEEVLHGRLMTSAHRLSFCITDPSCARVRALPGRDPSRSRAVCPGLRT